MKKQKILLVYTKAGGGHLAACKTIMNVMEKANPGKYEFELLDVFENAPKFVKNLMNAGYVKLIYNLRPLWNLIYFIYSFRPIAQFFISLYVFFARSQFIKNVKRIKPDGVIYTYFVSSPANKALKSSGLNIKNITVVTDLFTPPNVWFLNKNLKYIVASERAKNMAKKMGVLKENIKVFKGLTHPKFEVKKQEQEILKIKEKMGLQNDVKTVLFSGGGLGLKQTVGVLENLSEEWSENEGVKINLLVVCGRNKRQFKKVLKIIKKNKYENIKILPFEFVDNMDELIAVCDLGITKAGPATMMEFFLQGKNIILTDYIWGQEVGNCEFIVKNNFGFYEKGVEEIADLIRDFSLGKMEKLKSPRVENEVLEMGKYLNNYFKNI